MNNNDLIAALLENAETIANIDIEMNKDDTQVTADKKDGNSNKDEEKITEKMFDSEIAYNKKDDERFKEFKSRMKKIQEIAYNIALDSFAKRLDVDNAEAAKKMKLLGMEYEFEDGEHECKFEYCSSPSCNDTFVVNIKADADGTTKVDKKGWKSEDEEDESESDEKETETDEKD